MPALVWDCFGCVERSKPPVLDSLPSDGVSRTGRADVEHSSTGFSSVSVSVSRAASGSTGEASSKRAGGPREGEATLSTVRLDPM
jgi:hypothetical protein